MQRDRLIFDGYELNIEYAQFLISQIDNEFEKANQSSPSVIFDGTGISPRVVEACEMVEQKSESIEEEPVRLDDKESEQIPQSIEDEPLGLAYMDFEQLMLHGKYSEAMLPNLRQHMNVALKQIEQTQAESKQCCLYEVPE